MCLKRLFKCYHRPALKPLPPGLHTRLLALKVSRYLYYKITLFMSNLQREITRKMPRAIIEKIK